MLKYTYLVHIMKKKVPSCVRVMRLRNHFSVCEGFVPGRKRSYDRKSKETENKWNSPNAKDRMKISAASLQLSIEENLSKRLMRISIKCCHSCNTF